jgi:type IV pilus assembly protein PilE
MQWPRRPPELDQAAVSAILKPHPTARSGIISGKGFTLIELMIVVAVIAILAAIAFPSYTEHVRKSRRVEAKNALLDLASRQERFLSTTSNYATTPDSLGYGVAAYPIDVLSGSAVYYRITVVATNDTTGSTFTATAARVGDQTSDKCGSYTLTHLGVQGNTGNTAATAECW